MYAVCLLGWKASIFFRHQVPHVVHVPMLKDADRGTGVWFYDSIEAANVKLKEILFNGVAHGFKAARERSLTTAVDTCRMVVAVIPDGVVKIVRRVSRDKDRYRFDEPVPDNYLVPEFPTFEYLEASSIG